MFKAKGDTNAISWLEVDGEIVERYTDIISFEEVNGEVKATWQNANGSFCWPLYVTWKNPGKEFSMILSREGTSGYGLLSEYDIYGATFKGTLREDGRWNISIYNSQGNRCVGNTFTLYDSNNQVIGGDTNDPEVENSLTLESSYTCYEGESITVTGVYISGSTPKDISFHSSNSSALSFSDTSVLSPSETGETNTWYISTVLNAKKAGDYEVTLTAGGITQSTTIIIKTTKELGFSLSIGSSENNAVIIGEDGQLPVVANYECINQDTALEEAENITWTCSDENAIDIYDSEYQSETNSVLISLSLRGKKPGSYTITGTTSDGRSSSATVFVEPKIIPISDRSTITETTDVTMIQTTLNIADKEYLTNFLDSITCSFRDDYGAIGGAVSSKKEVTSDGKTGKLVYTLTPVYGGQCEFTFTSPGGQKVVETIYSGLETYPSGGNTPIKPNTIVYYKDGHQEEKVGFGFDDCLNSSSLEYNPRLAYLLISLATSAYQNDQPFKPLHPDDGDYLGGFPDEPLAITESLRNLGFSAEDIVEENYYTDAFDPNYEEDTTAYTIATKVLSDGDRIVTIVVRGSYGGFELLDWSKWANDWKGVSARRFPPFRASLN